MLKTTLYIDVTQLVHWAGKLTGIPRVMNEISMRYAKESNVEFIVWDKKSSQFQKIDIAKTLTKRGEKIYYQDELLLMGKLQIFPRILRKLKTLGVPIPDSLIIKIVSTFTNRKVQDLNSGDRLFILWGEQNDDSFIDNLLSLHKKGIKIIQISYDMLPVVAPQFSSHSTKSMLNYSRKIFPLCTLILSISLHTKNDIIKWLEEQGLSVPRIEVFRLGDDFNMMNIQKPKDDVFLKSNLKGGDYILAVGTIEARKNHILLYYSYKLAKSKNIELPKLIVVGRKGWLTDDLYEILKLDIDIKESIILLETASDEELGWLYKNALFSIYPSFYEGWGLPIAESLLNGLPCLASNTSSMPEIADDLITYFNPYSTDECLSSIQHLTKQSGLKNARIRASKYNSTSWDQTFRQVKGIIDEQ